MSDITVADGPNASSGPLFVALYSNLYTRYGLHVTWVNTGLNPYPTKASFNNPISVFNYSLKTPFSVPYSTYVYTKFAKAASKTFRLSSAG